VALVFADELRVVVVMVMVMVMNILTCDVESICHDVVK
jgi:hypothetical protein